MFLLQKATMSGNLSGHEAKVHNKVQLWWSPELKMATRQATCRWTKQYKHENLSAVNTQHKLTEDQISCTTDNSGLDV